MSTALWLWSQLTRDPARGDLPRGRVFAWGAVIFLLVGSFQAWRDERAKSVHAKSELKEITTENRRLMNEPVRQEVEALRRTVAELQEKSATRGLDEPQKQALIAALGSVAVPEDRLSVTFPVGCIECSRFATEIMRAFEEAGWQARLGVRPQVWEGLVVASSRDDPVARSLIGTLEGVGLGPVPLYVWGSKGRALMVGFAASGSDE